MFEHFLLSLVLVNTLCMAIEYEGKLCHTPTLTLTLAATLTITEP